MDMMQQKKQRNTVIDAVKGIAIILVVFGHSLNNIIDSPRLSEVPASIIFTKECIYSFHMPLFFFLSGIFAYASVSKRSFFGIVFDKAKRLLVPYVFWAFMVVLVKECLPQYQNHPETWADFWVLWKEPFGIYWFIFILFYIFVLYGAIVKIFRKEMLCACIFIGISVLLYLLLPHSEYLWGHSVLHLICRYQIYFSMGLFGKYLLLMQKMGYYALIFAVPFPLLYMTGNRAAFLLACSGILLCFSVGVCLAEKQKVLGRLGLKTMDIYCMHQFIAGIIRILLLYLIGTDYLWPRVFVVTIVGIAGSYAVAVSPLSESRIYRFVMGYRQAD